MQLNQDSLDSVATIKNEEIVSRELEGEAVILNMESGVYFGLNEVGTRIWALIQEHGSLRKVLEAMQNEYEVAPEELENDLLQLIGQLNAHGLISLSRPEERK